MDLTPVRIRGKKRNRSAVKTVYSQSHASTSGSPSAPKRPRTSTKKSALSKTKKQTVAAMPSLQGLPQELLEMVFLSSMNIALPQASPDLGRRLSSRAVIMEFVMRSFFHTVDHKANIRNRKVESDPELQSQLLACKFFTWEFFLAYVNKAHDALVRSRGRIWKDASVEIPGVAHFDRLWPFKFTKVTYLSFAEGFRIPEKILHGPWTDGKASLLYVLVSLNGEIDWEGSLAGETAKAGFKEAIREGNEYAVAALSVLLGIEMQITTEMIRYAVMDCGCDFKLLRHILYNAQILYNSSPKGMLDFHDPRLWQWADQEGREGGKGDKLKSMLSKAERFSFEFYMEDETVRSNMVAFPYSGDKFDTRSGLDMMVRELLTRLYRSYANFDEMGDADITTSQWRLVEVGRVVIFSGGQYDGRLATIVEIIDHKRVLVDGPSEKAPIPRQSAALSNLSLTPIVISKLPRAAGVGYIKKRWAEEKVDETFAATSWAKKRAQFQKRRQLNDFERFKVMKLRKQARFEVQKTLAKVRAKA
ncbi:hypothetical protein BS50DRAFT_612077 [Corynespora cassiicola Philippines]|uniref:Large ribosomal subunit protein eL14 domain-containing protein n=1 Tax=Corynespora cassiicola Philippines TaxID=1448308 RepID=A0A2T2NE86_CORCC|nr:hypothetical protein BS50DRAFT_612077 [Corynespora cassiicola Philippines]